MLEIFRRAIQFDRDRRLRRSFGSRRLLSDKTIAELDGAPPNGDGGNEKKRRCSDQRNAIVMLLNPVDCFAHGQKKRTTDYTDITDGKI
jgi:hypothetical protein